MQVLHTEQLQQRSNQMRIESATVTGSQPSQAPTPYEQTDPNVLAHNYSDADEEIKHMLQEEDVQDQRRYFEESSALDNAVTELKNYLDSNREESAQMKRAFDLTKLDHFGYRLEQVNPVEGQEEQETLDVTLRLDQDTILILLEDGYADFIDFLTERGFL